MLIGFLAGCSSAPIAAVSSTDPDMRREAIARMGSGRDANKHLPFFLEMFQKDTNPLNRALIARYLGKFKYQPAVPDLVKALNDPSPVLRQDSAIALGEIADKSAIPPLLKALEKDAVPDVRRAIVQSLRPPYITEPEPAVLDDLVERLNDVNSGVGYAAWQSLQSITSQNIPNDQKEWEKWREANKKPQIDTDKH